MPPNTANNPLLHHPPSIQARPGLSERMHIRSRKFRVQSGCACQGTVPEVHQVAGADVDPDRPAPARIYDYLLGGKDSLGGQELPPRLGCRRGAGVSPTAARIQRIVPAPMR